MSIMDTPLYHVDIFKMFPALDQPDMGKRQRIKQYKPVSWTRTADMSATNIALANPEVMEKIMLHLPLHNLIQCSRVRWLWRNIFITSPKIRSSLLDNIPPGINECTDGPRVGRRGSIPMFYRFNNTFGLAASDTDERWKISVPVSADEPIRFHECKPDLVREQAAELAPRKRKDSHPAGVPIISEKRSRLEHNDTPRCPSYDYKIRHDGFRVGRPPKTWITSDGVLMRNGLRTCSMPVSISPAPTSDMDIPEA